MASGVLHRHNVHVEGSGQRTLVFGHGLGADQRIWRRLVPRFSGDHRIVLYDYVGVGASDRSAYDPERYRLLDRYADDLIEILTALELHDAVFVGHSASAMIGVLAAIRAPERFSRLVLLAGSARYLNDPPYIGGIEPESLNGIIELMDRNFLGWSRLFVERASQDPVLRRQMDETFQETDRPMLRQFVELTLRADIRGVLGRVSTPSLVLPCTYDEFVPPHAGRYLGEHLPRATLVWLDCTGHCPQFSDPVRVEGAIRSYLSSEAGSDRPPPLAA